MPPSIAPSAPEQKSVSTAIHAEIDFALEHMAFRGEPPGTTPAQRRASESVTSSIPPGDAFDEVFWESFWASTSTEEGRPTQFRLSWYAVRPAPSIEHHLFERDAIVPITRESIRRLAPAHDFDRGHALLWSVVGGKPFFFGIALLPVLDTMHIVARAPAALDVEWFMWVLLRFSRGEYSRVSESRLPTLADAMQRHGLRMQELRHAIRAIVASGHGGSIWMTNSGTAKGIDILYSVELHQPAPGELHDAARHRSWVQSIASLAAVDGAVLVDSMLRVRAFGVFSKIPTEPMPTLRIATDGSERAMTDAEIGGARHRAAIAFCHANPGATAIVVSQDGSETVVWRRDETSPVRVADLAPVGNLFAR